MVTVPSFGSKAQLHLMQASQFRVKVLLVKLHCFQSNDRARISRAAHLISSFLWRRWIQIPSANKAQENKTVLKIECSFWVGQRKSTQALIAHTASQGSQGLWSVTKPYGGITFLGDFLFSLSHNRGEKFPSQTATHQAERKKSCHRGNRQPEQEGDWRCWQDRPGNPLYALQSCCSHRSLGDRAEGQMPGEGSNSQRGMASCGNSHCLEKVIGC